LAEGIIYLLPFRPLSLCLPEVQHLQDLVEEGYSANPDPIKRGLYTKPMIAMVTMSGATAITSDMKSGMRPVTAWMICEMLLKSISAADAVPMIAVPPMAARAPTLANLSAIACFTSRALRYVAFSDILNNCSGYIYRLLIPSTVEKIKTAEKIRP